ncbi:hypothetical protein [Streptomyces sp. FL07-04A]|uniref:hypothetical protein n=1 Tax=Streptomyces sp. FL07-04A TaxID=3028658 RepID=UPI0029A6E1B3|nr:hypothetical protein [Streptomyces sp. FL07-04A]MDX3578988.1 hypothetical protein [Streptomyces sp. FL07-04A]
MDRSPERTEPQPQEPLKTEPESEPSPEPTEDRALRAEPTPRQRPGPAPTADKDTETDTDTETDAAAVEPASPAAETADQALAPAPPATAAEPGDAQPEPADAPPEPPASDAEGGSDGRGPGRRRLRRVRRAALVLVLLLLAPILVAEAALRVNYLGDPGDGTYTRGKDAIWLGHAWVDGRKTEADVQTLTRRLADTGMRDLYVHAGPLEHDGTLPKSAYANARWFIAAVHREAPKLRVQAWLGDVLATETPDGMRLERPETRAAVVRSTREILAAGFEGAHFDLEPLHSDDADYLTLLDSLRAVTRAHHAQLSVAAHQIDPVPGFHSFWGTTTGHPKWWSQRFFGQVARRVDQIAVMSYDTMQPLQSTYGGYVAQQTSLALEVTPPSTDLLMGLPFYRENRFGHWAHAETVAAAVRGVRLGLSRTDADRENFGVAAYVDFAASETDWTSYQEGWVR